MASIEGGQRVVIAPRFNVSSGKGVRRIKRQFEAAWQPLLPKSALQERNLMAVKGRVCYDDRTSWDEALSLYRGQLSFCLDYLIECDCGDELLLKVEAEVRDRSVPDKFKQRFMLRVLVRNVIQHMRESIRTAEMMHAISYDSSISFNGAPPLERLIYFLRDILEYPTRDAALLVGFPDAQVEKVLLFARKRIDVYEGPVSIKTEGLNDAFFRWKFADLHPS
jgi:hypothetical protein